MALSVVTLFSLVRGMAAMRPEKFNASKVLTGGFPKVQGKPTMVVQESSRIVRLAGGEFHLTDDGAKDCDYGVTVTETACQVSATTIITQNGVVPDRSYMVSGNIKNAPPGCSIHTLMDWAVTYNTNTEGDNDGNFALVCHGLETKVHGVKEGENECDFGAEVKVDKCLGAVNDVLQQLEGKATGAQTMLHVGHWATLPPGCAMHVGVSKVGQKLAWYNTKKDAQNDGSYVLMCSGTTVPVR